MPKSVTYDEGRKIREAQRAEPYKAKHSDEEYLVWLEENLGRFEENHPQSVHENFPKALSYFSIPSQWVQGNSVRECLDRAIERK